ncbi:hypothetical protein PTE30175_01284 [Pandoraea terrae]|uniref:Transmembrane protein n=1 Tax=Pandoraea terrae TaxID=1537710 RepID=A0A5E4THA2_9BURK|nr:hypothetical protein [Pandoraea terrae]VVD85559.1 hypothetical protein PTE30175_01284 [Pandoraea terrae]
MPIDLSPAGEPSAYPARGPRLVPWLIVWGLCCAIGAAAVLLLWPTGTPASGAWFWFCVAGLPNGLFLILFGIARAGYEAAYLGALYRNQHRQAWLHQRVGDAQRPLEVLGVGYCLPLQGATLAQALARTAPLIKAQSPRGGLDAIVHGRFADDDPLFVALSEDEEPPPSEDPQTGDESAPTHAPAAVPEAVSPVTTLLAQALAPLAHSVHALCRNGAKYAPAVRVMASPDVTELRLKQVRDALRLAGLPALACEVVPAADGLMAADAWLDAGDTRPLLVVAAEWHTKPPAGSTEGAVAVLLGAPAPARPEPVGVMATLHRPVAGALDALPDVLANAALWGKADARAIRTAWISGLDSSNDGRLSAAFKQASLAGVAPHDAQRRPDRIIGHAGAAGGWLAIAAAIEACESVSVDPQLIVHAPQSTHSTESAQAAILYVTPIVNTPPSHDDPDE